MIVIRDKIHGTHYGLQYIQLSLYEASAVKSSQENQEMETALCCLVSSNPSSWAQQLVLVEYAHNMLTSSATGLTPFQCGHGFQPPLFPALEKRLPATANLYLTLPMYAVQCLLRPCHRGQGTQYLVDCEGYGPKERSWVPTNFIVNP